MEVRQRMESCSGLWRMNKIYGTQKNKEYKREYRRLKPHPENEIK
jgi:hypothetical protein